MQKGAREGRDVHLSLDERRVDRGVVGENVKRAVHDLEVVAVEMD